jgi:hypothetical protein
MSVSRQSCLGLAAVLLLSPVVAANVCVADDASPPRQQIVGTIYPPVDISGRYVGRLQSGFCETLLAPPSIFDVTLTDTQQITNESTGEVGVRYGYDISITLFESDKIRSDCPPITQNQCTNSNGTSRCMLRATRYELQTGLNYTYGEAFGEPSMSVYWDNDDDLLLANFVEFAPGGEDGLSRYDQVYVTQCQPGQCWQRRWAEGIVDDLQIGPDGFTFVLDSKVDGDLADCENCANFPIEPIFRLIPAQIYWQRVSDDPDRLEISAPIGGKLFSDVPVDTGGAFDDAVERAVVHVLMQDGPVANRDQVESDADYAARVLSHAPTAVDELKLRPLSDGSYTFGEPGRFETKSLPYFRTVTHAGKHVWEPALYTLHVTGARSDELVRDPPVTGPPTGETTSLAFADRVIANLRPGQIPDQYALHALIAVDAKLAMIESVEKVCRVNYAPAEASARSYVEDLDAGTIELTPERNEGLQRAVWSELVVRDSALLAQRLLASGLEGLGNFVADMFDKFVKFESSELRLGKKRRAQIEDAKSRIDPSYASAFKLAPEDMATDDALTRAVKAADAADVADLLGNVSKSLRFILTESMRRAGIENEVLLAIPDKIHEIDTTLIRFVKEQTVLGAAKGQIKKAIQAFFPTLTDDLLDDDLFPYSYCNLTSNLLDASATRMQGWSTTNRTDYLADRADVVDYDNALNRVGTDLLVDLIDLKFYAEAADIANAVFSVVGKAQKLSEVIAAVAEGAKHGLNLAIFAQPAAFVFGDLRTLAAFGNAIAFDQPLPALRAQADPAFVRAALARYDAGPQQLQTTGLTTALSSLRAALASDDIGAAIAAFSGPGEDTVLAQSTAARAAVRAFEASVSTIDPTADKPDFVVALRDAIDDHLEFLTIEQQLYDAVSELLFGVATIAYEGPDDVAYRARRNRVTNLIDTVIERASELDGAFQDVESRASGATFLPAVVAEPLEIVSRATGESLVSALPETFDVSAVVRNVSTVPVNDVTARLLITSRTGATTIVGSADVAIATLAADDSITGSGADEQVASWVVSYAGSLEDEIIDLEVEILEGDASPSSFSGYGVGRRTAIDPDLTDADLDGLPDDWETAHGLNPTVDDADGDPDADGLINAAELDWGTLPDDADTDDDGRLDGAEVGGGGAAETTDPLDPDSDGDGLLDGADPAPNDPRPQTPAAVVAAGTVADEPVVSLDKSSVTLTRAAPVAIVTVSNAGSGLLEWAVDPDLDPAFAVTQPRPGTVSTREQLIVTVPSTFDFDASGSVTVDVVVRDVAGAVSDAATVIAHITQTATGNTDLCGHASGSGAEAAITATDALAALKGAVGISPCPPCRCDVDGSGTVLASDALIILRLAVGLPGPLDCEPCP